MRDLAAFQLICISARHVTFMPSFVTILQLFLGAKNFMAMSVDLLLTSIKKSFQNDSLFGVSITLPVTTKCPTRMRINNNIDTLKYGRK